MLQTYCVNVLSISMPPHTHPEVIPGGRAAVAHKQRQPDSPRKQRGHLDLRGGTVTVNIREMTQSGWLQEGGREEG